MTKTGLIEAVSKETGVGKKDAQAVINAAVKQLAKALKKGDKATIAGFGTFSVSRRKARKGRNPQTGATLKIAASKRPKFKPGKAFTEAIK